MLYSRWKPDTGGYEYFESSSSSVNINDDLPEPTLRPATKLGVPSIEAGRPLPSDALRIGEGAAAVGILVPVDEDRLVRRARSLSGYSAPVSDILLKTVIGAGLGLGLWWLLGKPRFR